MEQEKKQSATPLLNISPRAWEHPADRAALTALQSVPGINDVVRFFVGFTGEASLRLLFLSSAVRVSPTQFPRVQKLVDRACDILDVLPVPEVYVTQNPMLNAGAVGVDKPFITLNSALVQTMDDDELLAVIAHELGHIASGHVLYKTLLWLLVNASSILLNIPIGQAALMAIVVALREWDRKSELSADRAGVLVTQNPQVNYRVLMKLAGGSDIGQMNMDDFFQQAADYDQADGTMINSLHKVLNLLGQTHPFPVIRLTELKTWVEGGSYQAILKGDYEKRSEGRQSGPKGPDFTAWTQDFQRAQQEYRDELKRSKDPLAQALSTAGENLEKSFDQAKKAAEEALGKFFHK